MKAILPARPGNLARALAAAVAAAAVAVLGFAGCSSKLEDKECTKLKIEAFDVVNKAQHCNNDVDCKGSFWPDCGKPLSAVNGEEIKKKEDAYYAGKCEEAKPDCKDTTPIYCKQGLCTRKEKGAPENPGGTAPGDIIIK